MTRKEAIKEGYTVYCIGCCTPYKLPPTEQYEDGHGGRRLERCKCGCDLFASMTDNSPV